MTCVVRTCTRERQRDSRFCSECLDLMWGNRLDRLPDGTYEPRVPEWVRRAREHRLPAKDWAA